MHIVYVEIPIRYAAFRVFSQIHWNSSSRQIHPQTLSVKFSLLLTQYTYSLSKLSRSSQRVGVGQEKTSNLIYQHTRDLYNGMHIIDSECWRNKGRNIYVFISLLQNIKALMKNVVMCVPLLICHWWHCKWRKLSRKVDRTRHTIGHVYIYLYCTESTERQANLKSLCICQIACKSYSSAKFIRVTSVCSCNIKGLPQISSLRGRKNYTALCIILFLNVKLQLCKKQCLHVAYTKSIPLPKFKVEILPGNSLTGSMSLPRDACHCTAQLCIAAVVAQVHNNGDVYYGLYSPVVYKLDRHVPRAMRDSDRIINRERFIYDGHTDL